MTSAERDELIISHLPHVHWVASRMYDRLCRVYDFEDLVSMGVVGLISAVDRYDESYGVRLHTYAEYKIRGAILDNIRTGDGIAARQRQAAKRLRVAMAAVEQRLCRQPGEEETADEMGLSIEDYRMAVQKVTPIRLRSLDAVECSEESLPLRDKIAAAEDSLPSFRLERDELRQLIRIGIESLPLVQRKVVNSYYVKGQPLREIAISLGVHVTRVSQIKIQAVDRLRAYVVERWAGRKDVIGEDGELRKGSGTLVAC